MNFRLNRTSSIWDRNERININDNWDMIEDVISTRGDELLDSESFSQWLHENRFKPKNAVENLSDLPTDDAEKFEIRAVKSTNKAYVFNGESWVELSSTSSAELEELYESISNLVLGQYETITVKIPSDYPTINQAISDLSKKVVNADTTIELLVESGHEIQEQVWLKNGDYSHFSLISEDAEVKLSSTFPKVSFLLLDNAVSFQLNCLINGQGKCANGIYLRKASKIVIGTKCGFTRAGTSCLYVGEGSTAFARGGIFTYGSQDGSSDDTGGSGIVAWGGTVFAEESDISNSNTYGIQAAHGGRVSFRDGIGNDIGRYGARVTNGGVMDLRGASFINCGIHGIYAFGAGIINARSVTITNCETYGIVATGASNIDARDSVISDCGTGVASLNGSTVSLYNTKILRSKGDGVLCSASVINAPSAEISDSIGRGLSVSGSSRVNFNAGKSINNSRAIYASNVSSISAENSFLQNSTLEADVYVEKGATILLKGARTTNSDSNTPVLSDTNLGPIGFNTLHNFGIIFN